MKKLFLISLILLAIGISFGALGAHYFNEHLDQTELNSFKTGVLYQMICAIICMVFLICQKTTFKSEEFTSSKIILFGSILFSFSIYILSCKEMIGLSNIGIYIWWSTPLGGILILAGIILFIVRFSAALMTHHSHNPSDIF